MSDRRRFELSGFPNMRTSDGITHLESVQFTATRGEEVRSWVVFEPQLSILADVLSSRDTRDYLNELRHGKPVNFPKNFSPMHLALLGYRMTGKLASL